MKNFNPLELLRLVSFLPLIVVLLAMVSEDRLGTFQQSAQSSGQQSIQFASREHHGQSRHVGEG
jgi:hypothetical protein